MRGWRRANSPERVLRARGTAALGGDSKVTPSHFDSGPHDVNCFVTHFNAGPLKGRRMTNVPSIFVVRRSIHIAASPDQEWNEFASFERMKQWWA
jgi:hypothetical protein